MDCSGHPSLTFRHWAGVSTYTSDFSLAGTCVYGKQSLGPLFCHRLQLPPQGVHQLRSSLSRSYGCILPSSLTRVFPRTLGYSPRLPVSVLVRATSFSLEAFLGSVIHGNLTPRRKVYLSALSRYERDLPPPQPAAFDWLIQQPAPTFSCVTPLLKQNLRVQEY